MPRQYFIPGLGAVNETGRRQYFIPGMGAVNELGVANSSASFAEILSTSDGHAAAMSASTALAESIAPAEGYQPVPRYHSAFISGGFAINEGATRQFFVPGHGAINLAGRAKIVPPVSAGFSYPVSESNTTADYLASSAGFSAPTSDFAFASDLPAAQPVYPARLGRATLGRANLASSGKLPAKAAASGGVSALLGRATLGKARLASKGGATYNATFTSPFVRVSFGDSVVEQIALADILSALATFGDMLGESMTAGYGVGSSSPGDEPFHEDVPTSDDMAGISRFVDAIAEQILAGDSMAATVAIPTPIGRIIRAYGRTRNYC